MSVNDRTAHSGTALIPTDEKPKSCFQATGTKIAICVVLLVVGIIVVVMLMSPSTGSSSSSSSSSDDGMDGTLTEYKVQDDSVHCADGSVPSYYLRETGNENWIIFLEYGGSYCWDQDTCDYRNDTEPNNMGSGDYTPTKDDDGLISVDPVVNPLFYNYSVVTLPYCSSDFWLGDADPEQSGSTWYFQGAAIIEAVMDELLENGVLDDAETIAIWGQGAGGYGVLTQGDNIKQYLEPLGDDVDIRGVMDSSWIGYMEQPYNDSMPCTSAADCPFTSTVPLLVDAINPRYPQRCIDAGLTWECVFAGLSNIANIELPLFAFQWQYEISQLSCNGYNNGFIYESDNDTDWARDLAAVRLTEMDQLPEGSAYHYVNCNDHELATKEYISVRGVIDDASLCENVYNWFELDATILSADECEEISCNPTCGATL